jgi:hypothetical protein
VNGGGTTSSTRCNQSYKPGYKGAHGTQPVSKGWISHHLPCNASPLQHITTHVSVSRVQVGRVQLATPPLSLNTLTSDTRIGTDKSCHTGSSTPTSHSTHSPHPTSTSTSHTNPTVCQPHHGGSTTALHHKPAVQTAIHTLAWVSSSPPCTPA